MITRRNFLIGAPAVVVAANLMPLRGLVMPTATWVEIGPQIADLSIGIDHGNADYSVWSAWVRNVGGVWEHVGGIIDKDLCTIFPAPRAPVSPTAE